MVTDNDSKIAISPRTQRQRWDQESVKRAIQDRAASSERLNAKAVEMENSRLIAAARRLYGNWNNALLAAGVDPTSVRPPSTRRPRGSWSRETIIEQIRRYADREVPLYAHHMRGVDNSLVSAATYYFGSWAQALEAAGEDPGSIRRNIPRDSEQIIGAIRDLTTAQVSVRDFSIRRHHRALYGAAQKHFGSWRNALKVSGVEESGRGPNSRWSREDMQAIVLEYVAVGYPLSRVFRRHSHLKAAILREWGSLEAFQQDLNWDPRPDSDTIGKKLRGILASRGIAPQDFAKNIGIPLPVLDAYESGRIPLPLVIAHRIAVALEVSLDTFVDLTQDR